MTDDPFALDRETMRRLGYRTVDMLVERLTDESEPAIRRATPAEMRERIPPGAAPEGPTPLEEILAQLDRDVLPFAARDHPGFLAFVPFGGTWPGALGDLVASACNVYAGSWMESAGPSRLELEVLDWFKSWIGYPPEAGGVLVSGGSAANMTALACARETIVGPMSDQVVAYVSDQAHSSVGRSARVLGFRPDQIRVLPTGADLQLHSETLAAAAEADSKAGRKPLFVSASAGATNTGSIDPLRELATTCRERGIWLHVDGAYGGFSVLTERGAAAVDGLAEADSISLDPHKWLYQPFECGCVLVRDGARLRRAFKMTPDYLRDTTTRDDEVNFADLGMQLTRSARALKLWVSLRYFGLAAFRSAIDRSLDLAELAVDRIESSSHLELTAPPSLSVVCLRRRFDGVASAAELERRQWALVAGLEQAGLGLVATTRVRGVLSIRLCILSHLTDARTVERMIDYLEHAEVPGGAAHEARYERDPRIGDTWAQQPTVRATDVQALALFSSLSEVEASRVALAARVREASAGETVVAQWESSRDLFVILDGSVDVRVDGADVRRHTAGDFFGELAALDWGSGYAYSRLATVVAVEPTRLLVFSCDSVNAFAQEYPSVGEQLRSAMRVHLGRIPG